MAGKTEIKLLLKSNRTFPKTAISTLHLYLLYLIIIQNKLNKSYRNDEMCL